MIDHIRASRVTAQALVQDVVSRCLTEDAGQPLTPDVMRRCAAEARRAGLRPEELLVALRDAWDAQRTGRRRGSDEVDVRLTRLIHTALDAYFKAEDRPQPNTRNTRL